MKYKRHSKILEIINTYDIEKQEELAEKLLDSGFHTTQATISRDIKELKLVKVATKDGGYKYAAGVFGDDIKVSSKYYNIMMETILEVKLAGNLIVLKTYSGMAQAAAAALDAVNFSEVIGSIAGDDTVLLVSGNNTTAHDLVEKINKILSP